VLIRIVFKTELLEIIGVPPENAVQQNQEPPAESAKPSPTAAVLPTEKGSEKGPADDSDNNGECKLLGKFAIIIQTALGGLALLALVWKRWRERPRRPVVIWGYDVSKQVVGSIMVHFANLFLSMLSSGSLGVLSSAASVGSRNHPNPCSFYLLNLGIDTTIGIPILVFFLYVIHWICLRTPLANPPESLSSGHYGNPPNPNWWAKQALIYFLGLFCMKICVFMLFQIFPWLGWVGDWALQWTEGKEWVQITFVMLIFPLIMNAVQYWIIDNFIKDKDGSKYDFHAVEQHDSDGEDDDFMRGSEDGEERTHRTVPATTEDLDWRENKGIAVLPHPVEFDSDDEHTTLAGSSNSK
jgi:STIMATE family